jgi:CheY-like chemotaxis protein
MPTRIMAINRAKEMLELYHSLLTDEGYEVFVFTFGPTDLKEVTRVKPDVLILDVPPGENNVGWELMQKVRLQRATANIPVIFCTTQVKLMQEMEGFLATKRIAVVIKPFDIADLLSAITQAITLGQIIESPDDKKEHDER